MCIARSTRGREIICSTLDRLPNVRIFWPGGSFYFFFSIHGMNSDYDMARRILEEAGAGIAPARLSGRAGKNSRVCVLPLILRSSRKARSDWKRFCASSNRMKDNEEAHQSTR